MSDFILAHGCELNDPYLWGTELQAERGQARAWLIKDFTGIDDPYEIPESPELSIDTSKYSPEEAAQTILLRLEKLGYIK